MSGLLGVFAAACGDNVPAIDAGSVIDARLIDAASDSATDASPAQLGVVPGVYSFAPVASQHPSPATSFLITNHGGATTGLLARAIAGSDAAAFTIVADGCNTALAPGASCAIDVRFLATFGSYLSQLVVSAEPGGELAVMLTGTALGEQFLTSSPMIWDFGDVPSGQSRSQEFMISNEGGLPAGPLVKQLVADPLEFALAGADTCGGMTLAPGASCVITVAFAPTSIGSKTATFMVSQPVGAAVSVAILGNATP